MNNSQQVFKGGWDQLQHAKFTNSHILSMGSPTTVFWSPDGVKMYVGDGILNEIVQFTASTPWDITTLTQTGLFNINALETNIRCMEWSLDGKRCWIIGVDDELVQQLNLSTGWDISTMSVPGISSVLNGLNTNPQAIRFSNDGFTLYAADTSNHVFGYTLTTPFDITTLNVTPIIDVNFADTATNVGEIIFSPDEKYLYLLSRSLNIIFRYRLNVKGDINTAVFLDSFDELIETNPFGIHIRKSNGKQLYVVGTATDMVYCFDMSLATNDSMITELGEELITETGDVLVYQ